MLKCRAENKADLTSVESLDNAFLRLSQALEEERILLPPELAQAKKVLSAAALTYVAATLTAFLHFLRLFLLARRRNN